MQSTKVERAVAISSDPIVTASIYCAGHIDEVIYHVLRPVWQQCRLTAGYHFLWFFRSPRGGDHVKIRVHGTESLGEEFRRLLSRFTDDFFIRLSKSHSGQKEVCTPVSFPAIDVEDDLLVDDVPDRSLLWSGYRRSAFVLGEEALLADDAYVANMTRCLGCSSDVVLDLFDLDQNGKISFQRSQNTLLMMLVSGLAALFENHIDMLPYLKFHRDWTIRFPILKAKQGLAKVSEVYELLERHVSAAGRPTIEALKKVVEAKRSARDPGEALEREWRQSLSLLKDHLSASRNDSDCTDSFAESIRFPLLFSDLPPSGEPAGSRSPRG